jgi:uncharacterized membrane protein YhhN
VDTDQILILIFSVGSLAYLALIHKLPFPGDFVLKSIPALCLAVMAWMFIPGLTGKLLFAGFLFSAGGDTSLSFVAKGEKFFLAGLASFLIAHVLYVIAFAQNAEFSTGRLPLIVFWVVFAGGMAAVLAPKLGDMKIPVFAYVAVILGMVVFATLWQGPHLTMLIVGAVLFMLSDSMIAIDKFLKPISWSRYFIMVTYYTGQFLICRSFMEIPFPGID